LISLVASNVIGLKAVNCETGDVLAQEQKQAAGKEAVLKALDAAAVSLRSKLGESLSSVQKIRDAAGGSDHAILDALKAYSQGREMSFAKGHDSAMPFYQRAVELDPNFASAYAAIAGSTFTAPKSGLQRRMHARRTSCGEGERTGAAAYRGVVLHDYDGELEKAAEVLDLYQQTYPRDFWPWAASAFVATGLGNWEKALEEAREAIRLEPKIGVEYTTLAISYASLNRLDEGEAAYKQAEERKNRE